MERGENMFKNILLFILCLFPWFISSFIPVDYSYYDTIKLPFFAPPNAFYVIAWSIIYICIAISIYMVITSYKLKDIPTSYKVVLLINYLFNQSFTPLFFGLHNNFLGFISCLGTFISTLFLYQETSNLKEKSTKFLNPYVLLSLFATILSLTIYVINTL